LYRAVVFRPIKREGGGARGKSQGPVGILPPALQLIKNNINNQLPYMKFIKPF